MTTASTIEESRNVTFTFCSISTLKQPPRARARARSPTEGSDTSLERGEKFSIKAARALISIFIPLLRLLFFRILFSILRFCHLKLIELIEWARVQTLSVTFY